MVSNDRINVVRCHFVLCNLHGQQTTWYERARRYACFAIDDYSLGLLVNSQSLIVSILSDTLPQTHSHDIGAFRGQAIAIDNSLFRRNTKDTRLRIPILGVRGYASNLHYTCTQSKESVGNISV